MPPRLPRKSGSTTRRGPPAAGARGVRTGTGENRSGSTGSRSGRPPSSVRGTPSPPARTGPARGPSRPAAKAPRTEEEGGCRPQCVSCHDASIRGRGVSHVTKRAAFGTPRPGLLFLLRQAGEGCDVLVLPHPDQANPLGVSRADADLRDPPPADLPAVGA